jgi:toluene monooxygenase system protein B
MTMTQPPINAGPLDGASAPEPPSEPALIPLNALFADDFLQILVPVMSSQTITELAEAVAQHAEGVRVPSQDRPKVVFHNGRQLSPELTVAQAGIAPLDHVTVDYAG